MNELGSRSWALAESEEDFLVLKRYVGLEERLGRKELSPVYAPGSCLPQPGFLHGRVYL